MLKNKDYTLLGLKRAVSLVLCFLLICTALVGCRKGGGNDTDGSLESSIATGTTSSDNDSSDDRQSSSTDSFAEYDDTDDKAVIDTAKWINPVPERRREQKVVSKVVNSGDKYYVEYLGKPYLNYGVQLSIRTEHITTEEMHEEFYAKTAEIGFKRAIVRLPWRFIEPEKDKYNMYELQYIIDMAEKYDLLIELLWYGVNVCGGMGHSPDYITGDKETYPMYNNTQFPDYSNKKLLEREKKVLGKVMDYLYDNDKNCRVAMVQVLNEPNFSGGYDQESFYEYTNQLGLVVKNSPYSVATRVNLVINDSYLETTNTVPEKLLALDGIDMVGPDVYTTDLEYYKKFTDRFSMGTMATNVMHFAEAPGQMENYPKQVLYAFANNSGYDVYELKSFGNVDFDFGIFRASITDWIYRDGTKKAQHQWTRGKYVPESKTTDIIELNKMINRIDEQIARCPMNQFKMIFRRQSDTIGDQKITFVTAEERTANRIGAIFLAEDGYYYFFTPAKEGYFEFDGKTLSGVASVGGFVNGQWKQAGTAAVTNGNRINVSVGNVYRISATQLK